MRLLTLALLMLTILPVFILAVPALIIGLIGMLMQIPANLISRIMKAIIEEIERI